MERCGARWSGSARTVMPDMNPAEPKRRTRIALVSAIREEIAPLVRGWKAREIRHDGRSYPFFEREDGEADRVVAVCSGIGAEQGRRATEAVIQEARPAMLISVGFAGALDSSLKVADIVEPRVVVNGGDGSRTDTGRGNGVVVSAVAVAGPEQKRRLASAYGAIAVDMEGASVAMGAQAHGIKFAALKSISDELDFAMPPINEFVSVEGRFRHARFALHVAVRPWFWRRTIALARNSSKASHALCAALADYLGRETVQTLPSASLLAELNPTNVGQTEVGQEFASAHTIATAEAHTQSDGKH
jgi:nucleoside phosphorylase